MSEESITQVKARLDDLYRAAAKLSGRLKDTFSVMSFLSMPVVPSLKLTDKGLVDSKKFELIDLFKAV